MAKPASAEQKAATAEQRRVEQALERDKAARAKAQLGGLWSRRDFFGRFGWAIFGVFSGISLLAAVRSAFPRVLFPPPTSLQGGLPERLHRRRGEREVQEGPARLDRARAGGLLRASSPSARISAARRAGWRRRTSSSAPATAAASTRAASTSRARRRGRWSACASPRPRTGRSSSTRASSTSTRRASGTSPARS